MNIESINIFCGNVVKKQTAEEACAYFWHQKLDGQTLNFFHFCYRFLVCTANGPVPPE